MPARNWPRLKSWARQSSMRRGSKRWSRRSRTSESAARTEQTDMLPPGSPIHVRKLRPDGSQAYAWDGVVLRCDELGIVLRAQFNVDLVDLGFTTFRRGDEFVEFYYWAEC